MTVQAPAKPPKLFAISDLDVLDDFLARLSDQIREPWLIRSPEQAKPDSLATEDAVLEFLIRADTLVRRTFEQEDPVKLWVDDPRHPRIVRLGRRRRSAANGKSDESWVLHRIRSSGETSQKNRDDGLLSWIFGEAHRSGDQLVQSAASSASDKESSASQKSADENAGSESLPTMNFSTALRCSNLVIRSWDELDSLLSHLHGTAAHQWYVYRVGELPPAVPMKAQVMHRFLLDLDASLRMELEFGHCGVVFVDDLEAPQLVKIYQPEQVLPEVERGQPKWILSRMKPEPLNTKSRLKRRFKLWFGR